AHDGRDRLDTRVCSEPETDRVVALAAEDRTGDGATVGQVYIIITLAKRELADRPAIELDPVIAGSEADRTVYSALYNQPFGVVGTSERYVALCRQAGICGDAYGHAVEIERIDVERPAGRQDSGAISITRDRLEAGEV